MSRRKNLFGLFLLMGVIGACSASDAGREFGAGGAGGSSPANPTATGGGNTGRAGVPRAPPSPPHTTAQRASNTCGPTVHTGPGEVVATAPQGAGGLPPPADEDCDGKIDNAPQPCDTGIALDDPDPYNGAKAIELCQKATATDKKW